MKKGSIVILILFISFNIQAATTGKISGRITDKESGVPLMGTNVFILNSNLGAFTDIDGYFNILNVKAGKHDVSVQMIGYTPMTKVNAIVQMDLTTKVNFAMSASAIEMDAIIAEADRPIVQLDMSSSQMNISAEEIEALPVSSVSEVVGLQAGAEGLTIRGSSSSELSYNIDGLLMNDERSNTPYTSISMASIEMLKVQTGGFNAEYANANSGVVNITTKEGNRKYYSGAISIKYDPPQPKHFENSIYDPMGYHLRPYNDPEVMWTGTDNGAWDEDLQRSYPSFMGFNALSRQLIEDNNPDNDLSPAAVRELFLQQYRQKENTDIPDYVVDFGFGGPVPGFSNLPGNLRFFLSYREEQSAYVIPLSRDTYKDNNLNLKLTWDAGPKTKINMVLMNGKKNAVTTTNWSTPSTGAYFQSTWSVANLASNPAAAFIPSTYNPQTITRSNIGLTVKHQFDSNSFAELYFNSMSSDYHAFRDDARDSTLFDLFAENEDFSYMINEFPYGYYPNGPGTVIGLRTDWMGFAMDESEIVSNTLKGDYTNQINHYHQIKTGFVLASTNNKVNSWLENDKSTWRFYNEWDQNPLRFGTYIQDKMEYEELIVNAGIRVDMYNVRADWYDLDTYDELLNANNGFDLEEKAPTYKTKTISSLNPRLGIAHPISLKSKLYFNYGHFSMVPQSQYLYIVDRLGGGSVRKLGNPELEFSKSIQYEIGYEHSIIEEYLLKIAGYYKDEKNRPDWTSYTNYEGDVSYSVATSNSYKDTRGIELTLEKKYGKYITGFVNYTYHVVSSGHFGIAKIFQNPEEQSQYIRRNPVIYKPIPRPFARASLTIRTPDNFRLLFLPSMISGGWNINFLAYWKEGYKFNNYDFTYIENAFEWKDSYDLDMKASKNISLRKFKIKGYLEISNLLNLKSMSSTGFAGSFDSYYYYNSLKMWYEEGEENGSDLVGTTDKDKDYINMPNMSSLTYLYPRRITFGLNFSF